MASDTTSTTGPEALPERTNHPIRSSPLAGPRSFDLRPAQHRAPPTLLAPEHGSGWDNGTAPRHGRPELASLQQRGHRRHAHAVLMRALFERDANLEPHLDHVTTLAAALGQQLGFSPDRLTVLRQAAQLHDIGKIAIPDSILHKPGPLDDREWALMRQHTIVGQRILAASPALEWIGRIVRATHEHWDGRGYPDGLAARAIPLEARIIAICDARAAIMEARLYRQQRSAAIAQAEIDRASGTQFDPKLASLASQLPGDGFLAAETPLPRAEDAVDPGRDHLA